MLLSIRPTRFLRRLLLLATLPVGVLLSGLWLLTPVFVPSASMEPTLKTGAVVLLSRSAYWLAQPQVGDVVVFDGAAWGKPGVWYVKRVVGMAGDHLVVDATGRLTRNSDGPTYRRVQTGGWVETNGRGQHNVRLDGRERGVPRELTVEAGKLFVMGDNRPGSTDSRQLGGVPLSAVVGKVLLH